jgi:transposase
VVDWAKIYELTAKYYCEDNGRPSVDPVVLVKIGFLQHIYGIPSLRRTVSEIEVNIAYRWFLHFNLDSPIPHFATVSYAFATRFPSELFQDIFAWILESAVSKKLVKAEAVFIDATQIKASANKKKNRKELSKSTARTYDEQLREEINADRAAHGKKPLKDKDDDDTVPPSKETTVSTTDPDCGIFRKGEHKVEFAYTTHVACDKNNFVLEADVSAGNVHDSTMFDNLYKSVLMWFPEVEKVALDAGYKTPWIMKQIFDSERLPYTPYKRPMTKEGFFKKYEYVYDEYHNCIICPNNQVLKCSTTNRDGYREYKSNPKICVNCPHLKQCTESKNHQKTVLRHIWEEYIERAEDIRRSPDGKATYSLRSETIERVFADAKEKHAMRYTHLRGLDRVRNWVKFTFAAMNLKKMASWAGHMSETFAFLRIIIKKPVQIFF